MTKRLAKTSVEEPAKEPVFVTCSECGGRGIRPEVDERKLCEPCEGSGQVEVVEETE